MTPSVLGLAINIRAIYLAMDNVRAIFNDSKGLPNTFTCSIVIHYRTVVFFFFLSKSLRIISRVSPRHRSNEGL